MSHWVFKRIQLSGFLLLLSFICSFTTKAEEFEVALVCYFSAIDVLLRGEAAVDPLEYHSNRWSNEVKKEKARPNRSSKEYERGERP